MMKSGIARRREMLIRRIEVGDRPTLEPFAEKHLRGAVAAARRPNVFGDDEAPARAQHAGGFAIEVSLFNRMAEAFEGPDDIKRAVGKRHRGVVGLHEPRLVGQRAARRDSARPSYLVLDRRDADRMGPALTGEPKTAAAETATRIEHPLPGADPGNVGQHMVAVF